MQETVVKYVDHSKQAMASAEALVKSGNTFYVPFLCHQALQAILRGYILETQNRYPPLVDDLLRIADESDIGPGWDAATRSFVGSLSIFPEVVGNPVYRQKILLQHPAEVAQEAVSKTAEIAAMIEKRL
jgi:HEPN domain-containing protein